MRRPSPAASTAICADPRTCPAGWKLTRVSPMARVEILAVARRHDLQRLGGGQNRAVPRTRVIAVAVGDQGTRHRLGRVDVKIARWAVEPFGRWAEQGFRTHPRYLGSGGAPVSSGALSD